MSKHIKSSEDFNEKVTSHGASERRMKGVALGLHGYWTIQFQAVPVKDSDLLARSD